MKVKELIAELQKFDNNDLVYLNICPSTLNNYDMYDLYIEACGVKNFKCYVLLTPIID